LRCQDPRHRGSSCRSHRSNEGPSSRPRSAHVAREGHCFARRRRRLSPTHSESRRVLETAHTLPIRRWPLQQRAPNGYRRSSATRDRADSGDKFLN
jgi:hypothetical protein